MLALHWKTACNYYYDYYGHAMAYDGKGYAKRVIAHYQKLSRGFYDEQNRGVNVQDNQ